MVLAYIDESGNFEEMNTTNLEYVLTAVIVHATMNVTNNTVSIVLLLNLLPPVNYDPAIQPPEVLDIALQLHTQRTVIPAAVEPAVNL